MNLKEGKNSHRVPTRSERDRNWRQKGTSTNTTQQPNPPKTKPKDRTDRNWRSKSTERTTTNNANSTKQTRNKDTTKERWVKNISSKQISEDQISILSKGAGFAISPDKLQKDDYIVATELACSALDKGQAAALRAEVVQILDKAQPPPSNITKGERRALKELKKDDTIIICPADKGKCLVVMDKKEYIEKMEMKLKDETTYKRIDEDPTEQLKEEIASQLNDIMTNGQIDNATRLRLSPTQTQIPRMYGVVKIHKKDYPLREIVDANGGAAKPIDNYIAKIMKRYVGQTPHHVENTTDFAEKIKNVKIEEDEIMVSYDIVALYPSVPQNEAIDLLNDLLHNDQNLHEATHMTPTQIIQLFKTIVKQTYFMFNQTLYVQIDGLAIGAATSGFAANIFMEQLEKKALATFTAPPDLWLRYVDDTFTKLKKDNVSNFMTHLNEQHPRIKFTTEQEEQRKIAFLDTLVHRKQDGSTKLSIYRKPTHTDQYLNWNSSHHLSQKTGIFRTFQHRINTIITEEDDKEAERAHVKKALRRCGHPNWTMNPKTDDKKKEKLETIKKISIPYAKGTSERLSRVFRQYKIGVIHKPSATIKNQLCAKLKDKVHPMDKANGIYRFECEKHDKVYIGESERSLRYRAYEHKIITRKESKTAHSLQKNHPETTNQRNTASAADRPSTRPRRTRTSHNYAALHSGSNQTWSETPESYTEIAAHIREDHRPEDYTFKLVTTEEGWRKRTLKEALMIQKEDPERLLNENQGKHTYAHIYRLRTRPEAEKVFQIPESTANNRTESFDERPPRDANSGRNGNTLSRIHFNTEDGSQ